MVLVQSVTAFVTLRCSARASFASSARAARVYVCATDRRACVQWRGKRESSVQPGGRLHSAQCNAYSTLDMNICMQQQVRSHVVSTEHCLVAKSVFGAHPLPVHRISLQVPFPMHALAAARPFLRNHKLAHSRCFLDKLTLDSKLAFSFLTHTSKQNLAMMQNVSKLCNDRTKTYVICGPSGSGKTTLLEMITSFYKDSFKFCVSRNVLARFGLSG